MAVEERTSSPSSLELKVSVWFPSFLPPSFQTCKIVLPETHPFLLLAVESEYALRQLSFGNKKGNRITTNSTRSRRSPANRRPFQRWPCLIFNRHPLELIMSRRILSIGRPFSVEANKGLDELAASDAAGELSSNDFLSLTSVPFFSFPFLFLRADVSLFVACRCRVDVVFLPEDITERAEILTWIENESQGREGFEAFGELDIPALPSLLSLLFPPSSYFPRPEILTESNFGLTSKKSSGFLAYLKLFLPTTLSSPLFFHPSSRRVRSKSYVVLEL